jgi:hypothetical protein
VVAVRDDQLAAAGQRGELVLQRPRRHRPDGMGAAGLVEVGRVRRPGRVGGGGERGVQRVTSALVEIWPVSTRHHRPYAGGSPGAVIRYSTVTCSAGV